MKNLKESFLHEVMLNIKSREAKELVHKELNYHLIQAKMELLSGGMAEEEAEEEAIRNMGSPTELGRNFNKLYRPKMDWVLLSLFLVTIVMGLLPLLRIQDLYSENFLVKQGVFIVMGTAVALIVMFLDYRKMENLTWFFLGLGTLVLLALNFKPNVIINGVGYIRLPAGFTISGTTVLPILLMFWASYMSKQRPKLLVIFGVYLFTVSLYLRLPSLPCVVIYSVLVLALFCRSALKRKIIFTTIGTGIGMLAIYILLFWNLTKEYQRVRILAFLRPEEYAANAGYMYLKIKELLAGGGWFGNQKSPKSVPDLVTDLAFVNLTYYYGWVLAGFLVIILTLLLVRMLIVSGQVKDRYGKQLMVGVSALFSIQFVYNMGMVLGFLPIISISLPFISYGMTPTALNSLLIGIALSVYRRKHLVLAEKN